MPNLEQLDDTVNQINGLAEELRAGVHPNENEELLELQAQIRDVARNRAEYQKATEVKRVAMAQWEEEHAELIGAIAMLSEIKEKSETLLRKMTLEVYEATGNKKPCEGVGIREVTRLDYDPKMALEWGKKTGLALSLDRKAFEKIAQADTPEFVTITKEAQATISADLKEE